MAKHGFPWYLSKVEQSERHRHGMRVPNASLSCGVDLPPCAVAWLNTLPSGFRHAGESCLEELADKFIYGQLRDPFGQTNVRRAAEFVAELARGLVAGCNREMFVEVIRAEPRLVELGLIVALSQIALSREIPRDQEFYPAVIFDREVLRVVKYLAERDQPAVSLLWRLVCLFDESLADDVEASLFDVERGFAKTTHWPSPAAVRRLDAAIARNQALWESLARGFIVATQGAGGVLPMFAVEEAAKPKEIFRSDRVLFLDNINRPRQKRSTMDLLCGALDWPNRVRVILANLGGEFGSLRLYGAYVESIWAHVLVAVRQCSPDVAVFLDHGAEILERDIAHPIAAGFVPPRAVVKLFSEACSYDIVRKKRLSRQRKRCLREGLEIMDDDWVGLLRDIGTSYASVSVERVEVVQ